MISFKISKNLSKKMDKTISRFMRTKEVTNLSSIIQLEITQKVY